jgi:hypothetical protein
MLLAGAARRTITPAIEERPVYMAGAGPRRRARTIHDELWARALALRCGTSTVVLIVLDLLGLSCEQVCAARQQIAASGLPGDPVVIACTRNHAAPDVSGRWARLRWLRKPEQRYLRSLYGELATVARQAMADLQPAELYLARQQIGDVVGGSSLRELSVAQFRAVTGETIATLVNYPLVPQVLGPDNDAISADFCCGLYEPLEGPDRRGQVTLYTCAEAREEPAPAFRARTWGEAARVGGNLAEAVESALDDPPVCVERIGLWRGTLDASTVAPDEHGPAESEVSLLQVGPARVALLPGLVDPQVGTEVRRMLDAPYRFVVGPANDDLGYVQPQADAQRAPTASALLSTLLLDALDRLLLEAREASAC